ncbi:SCO1664 family protein [Corynebacterium glaucum]|nr:SCO1664 family protein [Corynebacterium glaucum]
MMAVNFEAQLNLLTHGEMAFVGQLAESSNAAFVVELSLDDDYAWAIYKPEAGEQYLHDFLPGLWRRERAAFLLSLWLGWNQVPPTVVRDVEPFGVGSLQFYVDNDGSHYFPLVETREDLHEQFFKLAVFDLLANNTDRKSGHVLLGSIGESGERGERVWGIDQGLCFHEDPKLRTVIWEFAHVPIPDEWLAAIEPLMESVPDQVAELLTDAEVEALKSRAGRLVRLPWLPEPHSQYQFPWPLV